MMAKLKNWLKERFSPAEASPQEPLRRTGVHPVARPSPVTVKKSTKEFVTIDSEPALTIEDAGPGKNVLIRTKYIREDTGTHETLKILDDSLTDTGEETGIDPYNTGSFDRSRNWSNRFRK
jgi:hypothetical protein